MLGRFFSGGRGAIALTMLGALLLSGCARKVAAPEPPPPVIAEPPAVRPTQPDLEAVWHVRSGLNVGALSCRGEFEPLADAYNRLLDRHEALLAQAYRFEETRLPQNELDRHLTQIYNHFANQRSAPLFCRTAQAVMDRALASDASVFSVAASGWLAELDMALR